MFKKNYCLIMIVFWVLFVPALLIFLYTLFLENQRPPEIVFYVMAAPWICLATASAYCAITRRSNLMPLSEREEQSLAMEILDQANLDYGSRLWLVKRALRNVDRNEKDLLCRMLASERELRELIATGDALTQRNL